MPVTPAIELRSVTRSYPFGGTVVHALRGVDVCIPRGASACVVGPSGSGKSTLLHVMGCLDTPSSGEVWIEGTPVGRLRDAALSRLRRERIGFVFQGGSVIPVLTALENVEYPMVLKGVPARARRTTARGLLEEVGLGAHADRYPNRLSGGQLQRVAIARALAGGPALLLADEPTAHLDSETSREVLGVLRDVNERRGSTLVIATHDPTVMRFAERTIRLHDGRIVDNPGAAGGVVHAEEEREVVHGF